MINFNSIQQAINYIKQRWIDDENKRFMKCYIDFLEFLRKYFDIIEIVFLESEENDVDMKITLKSNIFVNWQKSDFGQIEFWLNCYPLDVDEKIDLDIILWFEWWNFSFHTHFYNLDELKDFFIEVKNKWLKVKQKLQKGWFWNNWKVVWEEIYLWDEILDIVSYPIVKAMWLVGKLFNRRKENIKEEILEIKFDYYI